jgi:4-carboxymuconolactone decarboxylase
VVWDLVSALVRDGHVGDKQYEDGLRVLGERALVDLTTLTGYYCICSFLLNAFDVPLPVGARSPWDAPAGPAQEVR